jgi:hypothetical protein
LDFHAQSSSESADAREMPPGFNARLNHPSASLSRLNRKPEQGTLATASAARWRLVFAHEIAVMLRWPTAASI